MGIFFVTNQTDGIYRQDITIQLDVGFGGPPGAKRLPIFKDWVWQTGLENNFHRMSSFVQPNTLELLRRLPPESFCGAFWKKRPAEGWFLVQLIMCAFLLQTWDPRAFVLVRRSYSGENKSELSLNEEKLWTQEILGGLFILKFQISDSPRPQSRGNEVTSWHLPPFSHGFSLCY